MSARAWPLVPLLLLLACAREDAGPILAHGTVEVIEVDVGPLVPARVVRVLVEEGATVAVGDTLAVLTQATTTADLAQGEARVRAARARLRELEVGPRPQEIQRAEAEVAAAEAEVERARRDLERSIPLAEQNAISRQELDRIRAASLQAEARRDAAREALRLLRAGTRAEQIQAARAEVAAAEAALAAARGIAGDLVLIAPVAGTVLVRTAEPGEVLAAGQPALVLGEVARPYTRVYVSTRELAQIRNGQTAVARLDGLPGRTFAGRIVAIDDRAQFTPRIALTEDERADLMFGVKVEIADTTGAVKPGLPATVEFAREIR